MTDADAYRKEGLERVEPGNDGRTEYLEQAVDLDLLYCPDCGYTRMTVADRPALAFVCGDDQCGGVAWREGYGPVEWGDVHTRAAADRNTAVGLEPPTLPGGVERPEEASAGDGGKDTPTGTDAASEPVSTPSGDVAGTDEIPPPPPDDPAAATGRREREALPPGVDADAVDDELAALDAPGSTDDWYTDEEADADEDEGGDTE